MKTLYDLIKTEEEPERVKLISSKIACFYLRCSPSTLTNWRRRKYMNFYKGGNRFFYKEHEIKTIARWRFNGRIEKITKNMRNK